MSKLLAGMILSCAISAQAAGALRLQPSPEWRAEGDSPILYSINCSSVAWTLIKSSDTIRRSILIQASPDNPSSTTDGVCISSTQATATACTSAVAGVELLAGYSLTDYTTIAWYCRSRANATTTSRVKGYTCRDKGDYGSIGSAGLQ